MTLESSTFIKTTPTTSPTLSRTHTNSPNTGRGPILWHHVKIGLQQKRQMVRNCDARIHWKKTLQIQTSNTKTATTCTVSMRAQDIWKIGARPNCNRQFTTCRTRSNYTRPKSGRKHLILCMLGRQHPPSRTDYTRKQTGTRDIENNKKPWTIC